MFKRVLAECTVKNGEIIVSGLNSHDDIVAFSDWLRNAVLQGDIPHNKVIGAHIANVGPSLAIPDFISKRKDVNRSYAELYTVFDELIFEELDGNPFQGLEEENAISDWGYVSTCSGNVTSDEGMFYTGKGISATPRCLIKGVDIIKLGSVSSSLNMIVAKGTGIKTFSESGAALGRTDFVPFGQYYNLSKFITIRRVMFNDKTVKLMYKKDIDEEVLTSIFRNFGRM